VVPNKEKYCVVVKSEARTVPAHYMRRQKQNTLLDKNISLTCKPRYRNIIYSFPHDSCIRNSLLRKLLGFTPDITHREYPLYIGFYIMLVWPVYKHKHAFQLCTRVLLSQICVDILATWTQLRICGYFRNSEQH
jgi:hypothetical protein